MDDADRAGPEIENAILAGRAKSERDLARSLRPIVQEIDGGRHIGICHYCESNISPGHLFCQPDKIDPDESCSRLWEHERKRRQDMGI